MISVQNNCRPAQNKSWPTTETTDFSIDEGAGASLLANKIFFEEHELTYHYRALLESAIDSLRTESKFKQWRQATSPPTYFATKDWQLREGSKDPVGTVDWMGSMLFFSVAPKGVRGALDLHKWLAAFPLGRTEANAAGLNIRILSILQRLEADFGLNADVYRTEDGAAVIDYKKGDGRVTMVSRDDYLHVMGIVGDRTADDVLVGGEISPNRVVDILTPLITGGTHEE